MAVGQRRKRPAPECSSTMESGHVSKFFKASSNHAKSPPSSSHLPPSPTQASSAPCDDDDDDDDDDDGIAAAPATKTRKLLPPSPPPEGDGDEHEATELLIIEDDSKRDTVEEEEEQGDDATEEQKQQELLLLRRLIATSPQLAPFAKRALTLLCQVPRGRVTTYGLLAKRLGSSPRAVGGALRRNPLAPRVPCHRVVATGGALGGFKGQWGPAATTLDEKRRLLRAEGVRLDVEGARVLGTPWGEFV